MAEVTLPTGTVTFLITDIEGSTRLFHRMGEEYEAFQDAHRGIIRDAFAKRGGAEVACPGDGFLVAFGNAEDAVASAVEAQRDLSSFPWPDGAEVRVRMGLHSGAVRVTRTGGTYVGMALHEAARVAAAAHGGQILVSETTRANACLGRAVIALFTDDRAVAAHYRGKASDALSHCRPGVATAAWAFIRATAASLGFEALVDELEQLEPG